MLPEWVSNPGPLTYESGALPIALRDPVDPLEHFFFLKNIFLLPKEANMKKEMAELLPL